MIRTLGAYVPFFGIAAAIASALFVELTLDIPFLATGVGLAFLLVVLMLRSPKAWIATSILILPVFLTESGEGISAFEIVVGGSLLVSISLWVLFMLATNYTSVLRTWPDIALLTWLLLSALNVLVALANDVDIVSWFSEWALYVLILYYLPIREYYGSTESGRMQILTFIAVSSILQSLYSIWNFKQRMASTLIYAFQLESARSVLLGPIFLLVILGCVVAVFVVTSRRGRLLALFALLINSVALVITFTRTLWVMGAVGLLITLSFLTFRQVVTTMSAAVGTASAAVSVAYALFPKLTDIALMLIKKRFLSSSRLRGGDYSFETRIIEANAAWERIVETPLGGQGIRSTILAWDPILQTSAYTPFIHFGYVGLTMKLGFPLVIFLVTILSAFLFRGAYDVFTHLAQLRTMPSLRIMGVLLVAYTPIIYVVIFMSGVFDQRYGMFLFAFLFAMSAILRDNLPSLRQRNVPAPSSGPSPSIA